MLSVHGRREDGFHGLTSVVVALAFGDTLKISLSGAADSLVCSDPQLPVGSDNLILRAADAFRAESGLTQTFAFDLEKRIPVGAGLGGGSGNATVALKAMNELCGNVLEASVLSRIAADLGSDCPFFMDQKPALMSGRGEQIEALPQNIISELAGTPLLLFKPDFAVETKWAYDQLINNSPKFYESLAAAQVRLNSYSTGAPLADLLFNSFQTPIAKKFIAIQALLEDLQQLGVPCLMSGSGSCCFALQSPSGPDFSEIERLVRAAWGESVFFVETSILDGETNAVSGGI